MKNNSRWLLLMDSPRSAAYNMAKDEYCLQKALKEGRPVLRLYQWDGPALSAGRNQKIERELRLAECSRAAIPIVRRITGGRGVLHGADLTYSVAAPNERGVYGAGLMAIYRQIAGVLLHFLRSLGLEPTVQPHRGRERVELSSPVCFATPSAFEILIQGKKLVGSAQRLLPKGFLQHGSIPLKPQYARLATLFKGVTPEGLREVMTDLESLGPCSGSGGGAGLTVEELSGRLVEAFESVLQAAFDQEPWRDSDEAAVTALTAGYPLLNLPDREIPSAGEASGEG